MSQRYRRLVTLTLLSSLFATVPLSGQDEAKSDPAQPAPAAAESPAEQPAAATAPQTESPAAEPAPAQPLDAKAAAEAYKSKLDEWKSVLKELRNVRQRYDTADESQVGQIQAEWNSLIQRGEALIPELRAAGMKAYQAAPKEDRDLERFLVKVLKDDIAADRYEEAAVLGKALVEAGCEVKEVVDAAGVAAFCTNDFDSAEKYLTRAQNEGSISRQGSEFLPLLAEYREYWTKEQEIRDAEAKADDLPRVKISTNKGDIVIELFENEAPGAVGNFISLVEKKFYDGLVFHRVLPAFMAQGGCPNGTGTGGPGYNIYCECYQPNYRKHFRGTLSMAHAGRDTGGSQFFLTFVPTAHLNGRHTAFGRVIEGMDVLSKIERVDPSEKEQPQPDTMVKVEVLRKRDHEYKPNKVQ